MPLVALVFAALIGLALGTLGGGGSVLTVPVLVYLLGYDPKVAVPTSLGVVGAASIMGALGHWRAARIDVRVAIPFGLVAMIGAFAGARIAARLSGTMQLAMLSIVMVVAATQMLRRRPLAPAAEGTPAGGRSALQHAVRLAPVGFGVGLLTSIVGVGGGFLIVPALVLWGGLEMPTAVGTSLILITLNCATGLVGYWGRVNIPWGDTALFTVAAMVGAIVGTIVVGGVPPHRLRQAFAVFLLGIGGFVLYRNRNVFLGRQALIQAAPAAAVPRPSAAPATAAHPSR